MSRSIGKHAIVVGAGMGGLAAAKALSAHFDHVTVLERDSLSSDAEPRRGTPQARHLHGLLTGGLNALTELLPGLENDLERAGAVRLRSEDLRSERPGFDPFPQRDLGLGWWSVSRPLLEFETRRHIERQKNIECEAAHRTGRIELLRHRHECRAVFVENLHDSREVEE